MDEEIKEKVRERYSKIAREGTDCCSGCGPCGTYEQAKKVGYSEKELGNIPESACLGLGCGNPTAIANLKAGESVLDLGSGAGIDAFLAANKVGPEGQVIGVDMSGEMVRRANKIARANGHQRIEFKQGEIEDLPLDDNTVDVIISNCVINLSPDKLKTYQEAYRVLKPGGRILISDLVTEEELPEDIKNSFEAWSDCIGGALEKEKYLDIIRKTGFSDVKIISQNTFDEPELDDRLVGKITSVKVEAYKSYPSSLGLPS